MCSGVLNHIFEAYAKAYRRLDLLGMSRTGKAMEPAFGSAPMVDDLHADVTTYPSIRANQ